MTSGSSLPTPVVPSRAEGPSPAALRRVLRRARDGVALNVDEAAVAMTARGEDLIDLCASAARVRDAGLEAAGRRGARGRLPVSYSRKVFIPVTHLCRDTCHYCTFVTVPGKLLAAGRDMYLEPDEIVDIAARGTNSVARRRCSPSATGPRRAGRRPGSGSTNVATTRPCPTCAPWRSGCWRRPVCCRTSTPG